MIILAIGNMIHHTNNDIGCHGGSNGDLVAVFILLVVRPCQCNTHQAHAVNRFCCGLSVVESRLARKTIRL